MKIVPHVWKPESHDERNNMAENTAWDDLGEDVSAAPTSIYLAAQRSTPSEKFLWALAPWPKEGRMGKGPVPDWPLLVHVGMSHG